MDPRTGAPADSPVDPQSAPGALLFERIAGLDEQLRARLARLPRQAPPAARWVGILFRVGARRLLAPLDQIAEVLSVPAELTPLPGTAPWALGVANNRGTLLPVFDLGVLVDGGAPARADAERVLVVRDADLPCGLVVSEVVGIRRFPVTECLAAEPGTLGVLEPFAQAAFALGAAVVPVIALDRLLADPLMDIGSG